MQLTGQRHTWRHHVPAQDFLGSQTVPPHPWHTIPSLFYWVETKPMNQDLLKLRMQTRVGRCREHENIYIFSSKAFWFSSC